MEKIIVLYNEELIYKASEEPVIDLTDYDDYDDYRVFEFRSEAERDAFIRALDEHDWALDYTIVYPNAVKGLPEDEEEEELKEFEVTYYYHTNATVKVQAMNEREAVVIGYEHINDMELLEGLQEDSSPDVVAI